MNVLTPAKKAFLMAIVIYALLLLLGYIWYNASAETKTERVTLTTVPVTLAMFQSPEVILEPTPAIIEETPQPEPIKPVEQLIEQPIEQVIEPIPKKVAPVPKPIEPKIMPEKTAPPPKKEEVTQKPLEVPKETPKETPSIEPKTETKKILPPPIQATEPTKEITTEPAIHPNLSDKAEQSYLSELNAIIAQHAYNSYPRRAKRRNWQGEVLIQFILQPNGRITRLSIVESSGRQLLDNAALEIFQLKMNHQFKPFPKEIVRTQWRIEVPVSYNLN